nr:hypothetical protein L204_02073 [Cryptococcus depauperatus CBS 7855]
MSSPPARPTVFLSLTAANALISDLRPTTFSPPALASLNALLDELLVSLINFALSLNPTDLRREAIPAFFNGDKGAGDSTGTRALGRSAVAEAEVELRGWCEGRTPGSRGFPPDGKGRGTRSDMDFPLVQAVELMRVKCASYSTLAPQNATDPQREKEAVEGWKKAGGDASEATVEPAGLWLTAIIEHVCEHILFQVARVVARDSGINTAGPQDLYTALCEDESVWGFFKRMKIKDQLELAIRTTSKSKRSTSSRASPDLRHGRSSPAMSSSPAPSRISLSRDGSMDTIRTRIISSSLEGRTEASSKGGIAGELIRKGSTLSRRGTHSTDGKGQQQNAHGRSSSVLSVNTRSILGAFNDSVHDIQQNSEEVEEKEAQEEFDKLVKSGETLKVSLTPSRLKNFEGANGKKKLQTAFSSTEAHATSRLENGRRSNSISRVPVPIEPNSMPEGISIPHQPNMRVKQSGSGKKLVARTAKVIEEEDEDDFNSSGGPQSRKESLFDMLTDDKALGSADSKTNLGKRTVPAVVLGTPPPSTFQPSQSHVSSTTSGHNKVVSAPLMLPSHNQRPDHLIETLNDITPAQNNKSRARTDAQELADFLNTVPPPGLLKERGEEPLTTTSKSRFKGFMDKVTGGKKKEEEKQSKQSSHVQTPLSSTSLSRLNSVTSANGFPLIGKNIGSIWEIKKQKSIQTMGPPSVNRQTQPPPHSVPSDHVGSLTPDNTSSRVTTPSDFESVLVPDASILSISSNNGRNTTSRSDHAPVQKVNSDPVMEDEHTTVGVAAVATAALADVARLGVKESDEAGKKTVSAKARKRSGTTIPNEQPLVIQKTVASTSIASNVSGKRSLTEDLITISKSFEQANNVKHMEEGKDIKQSSIDTISPTQSQPTNIALKEPTIALKELVPLRHLLDYATSATECRLLLDAILTQYGVPVIPTEKQRDQLETPEARVSAWLLAGREGPVGDYGCYHLRDVPELVIGKDKLDESRQIPSLPLQSVDEDGPEDLVEKEQVSNKAGKISSVDGVRAASE